MLESLQLQNVGPAQDLKINLAPRLNLITGDNGLGKTLLLDVAWWALTGAWPATWGGQGVVPERKDASIEWAGAGGSSTVTYDFQNSRWGGKPIKPGEGFFGPTPEEEAARNELLFQRPLVIYLRVDGGISIRDPLRIGEPFRMQGQTSPWGRSNVYQFRERDIWDGLEVGIDKPTQVCEGLVRDVSRWAGQANNAEFEQLTALVEKLSGSERFRLTNKVRRVYLDDSRDFPLLVGPAGELPAVHAPAGLRRILGLAYLVVWAWREHKIAAELKKRKPTESLILLIDEVESHLHPKWQRTILPSLLGALNHTVKLQVIATTHSPMVLASAEPVFNVTSDKLFLFELENQVVALREQPWAMQGDVINWLVSDSFGLRQARSVEAEQAIEAAEAWMRGDTARLPSELGTKEAIHKELSRLLPGHDPFWPRWVVQFEKAQGKP
jgi:hypothetical protein